jgi:hypothetical protein
MARPWHDLPNIPDTAQDGFNVVIEIPKGSKVKLHGAEAALAVVRESFRLYRQEESRLRGWG